MMTYFCYFRLILVAFLRMSLSAELASSGWHLSEEGIKLCSEGKEHPNKKDVIKQVRYMFVYLYERWSYLTLKILQAMDKDLKEIGLACLPEDINRGKLESVDGGLVLQITKVSSAFKMSQKFTKK